MKKRKKLAKFLIERAVFSSFIGSDSVSLSGEAMSIGSHILPPKRKELRRTSKPNNAGVCLHSGFISK